ncbi:hypothetical protein KAX17_05990 [Candidatus Bipolaricaulota bacterium]|nr:hypothetical protein [Candidatus Bipolaricaulota bacterium]
MSGPSFSSYPTRSSHLSQVVQFSGGRSHDLTIISAIDPPSGTTRIAGSQVQYTPDPDFCGDDSFTYTIAGDDDDDDNDCGTATVYVTAKCVNDPPVANDDPSTANEDTAIGIDVLANDADGFDLSLDLDVRIVEDLHVLFDGAIGWDRGDATAASFSWGVCFDLRFDLPIPFLVTKGRIEGRAFVDQDRDGWFSPDDHGVSGIVVATERSEVSTDESGYFRFPPFAPGTYTLELQQLPPDAAQASPVRIDLKH